MNEQSSGMDRDSAQVEKDKEIDALAAAFHDNWRNTYQNPQEVDGKIVYEPRVKVLVRTPEGEEAWVNENKAAEAGEEIRRQDIANTDYPELDPYWQAENKAAAKVIVDIRHEYGGEIDLTDPVVRSDVGNKIHNPWLDRNPGAKHDPEVGGSFDTLSPEQQARDLDQMIVAEQVLSPQLPQH